MPKLFLSYRRDDSADVVGRLRDWLVQHFGEASVFTDVDDIPPGAHWAEFIEDQVAQSDVLLAVIGNQWLSLLDDRKGGSRDYVRTEIESALKHQIPIIPVLVGEQSVPGEHELPESLRELAFRQGVSIQRDPDFRHGIQRLIGALERYGIVPESTTDEPTPDKVVFELKEEITFDEKDNLSKRRITRTVKFTSHNPRTIERAKKWIPGEPNDDDEVE